MADSLNLNGLEAEHRLFSHLDKVLLVFGDGLEDFIDEFVIVLAKFLACLDLGDMIFFLQELEEPVFFALLDLDATDVFEVRIDPDPEDRALDVFYFEEFSSLMVWILINFKFWDAKFPLIVHVLVLLQGPSRIFE